MGGFWLRALLVLLFLTPASAALGQSKENIAKARAKYEEGKVAYRLGKFDEAIAAWQGAYELKPDPIFLYNIAQAYREAKNYERAVFFYRSYLNETRNPKDREVVEQRITEMEELLDMEREREAAEAAKPPPQPPAADDAATGGAAALGADTGAASGGANLKLAGMVTGGAGVAMFATGIVVGLLAKADEGDVQDAVDNGEPWTSALQDQFDSGESKATVATITLSLGAVALVGGGVLYYLGMRRDKIEVAPTVSAGGAGVTFTVRY